MAHRRVPFSAPATLERQKARTNWFSSAKEVFMRPWRMRSQRRAKRRGGPLRNPSRPVPPGSASLTSFEEEPPPFQQQQFPNFSRLSPLGGRAQSGGKKSNFNDMVDGPISKEKKDEPKIPEYPQSSRPPLSNIFPMVNSPEAKMSIPEIKEPERPEKSTKEQRRHSTPATPNLLPVTPIPSDRRQSASSDTSMDQCRLERRVRRSSVTRDLPSIPKRGQDPLLPLRPGSAPHSKSAPVSPYSEYTGPPLKTDPDQPDSGEQLVLNFGPTNRPPVAPGGLQSNFSYPPSWLQPYQQVQPYQQLQELEEELEEDGEGDGEEEGVTKIDELTQDEQKHTPAPPHREPRAPENSKEGGRFGKKLLSIMSSSKSKAEPAAKAEGKGTKLKGGNENLKEEEDPDIKGFDDFFMY